MITYNIDITELLSKGVGEHQTFSIPLKKGTHEKISLPKGLRLKGEIAHLGDYLLINFSTKEYTAKLACVRCLTETDQITSIDQASDSYSLLDAKENDFPLLWEDANTHQKFLDITPLVKQELEMSIDHTPLCKADCRGLCPNCGKDLNKETCTCSPATSNSAFSHLKPHFPPHS
ncbi:MAG: DUF177 domain-containing protein [Candidatus Abawacabacteria bacterium]|nr:DUF177 domain-containing protein [Candidatus Abawacabacteria bacterium]